LFACVPGIGPRPSFPLSGCDTNCAAVTRAPRIQPITPAGISAI
jgi:hypothetical protein